MDAEERRFLQQEAGLTRREVKRAARAEAYNWRELRHEVARILRPARRLLELGAGGGVFTGQLLRDMLRPPQTLVSLDLGIEALQELAKRFPTRFTPLAGDICHLPPSCRDFDLVVTHLTLHDLELDYETRIEGVMAGIVACLSPRGKLLLIDKVLDGVAPRSGEILLEQLVVELGKLRGRAVFGLHRLDDYLGLLAGAELTVTRQAVIGVDPGPRQNRVIATSLRKQTRCLAGLCPVDRRAEAERLIERASADIAGADEAPLPWALLVAERGK